MKVFRTGTTMKGVPDYVAVFEKFWSHFVKTGDNNSRTLALHYARVAEEMGQAVVDDEPTLDEFISP